MMTIAIYLGIKIYRTSASSKAVVITQLSFISFINLTLVPINLSALFSVLTYAISKLWSISMPAIHNVLTSFTLPRNRSFTII